VALGLLESIGFGHARALGLFPRNNGRKTTVGLRKIVRKVLLYFLVNCYRSIGFQIVPVPRFAPQSMKTTAEGIFPCCRCKWQQIFLRSSTLKAFVSKCATLLAVPRDFCHLLWRRRVVRHRHLVLTALLRESIG